MKTSVIIFVMGMIWLALGLIIAITRFNLSYATAGLFALLFCVVNGAYILMREKQKKSPAYQPITPVDLTKPPQGHSMKLFIDDTPIKPVTGVGEATAGWFTDAQDIVIEVDYREPPVEFRLITTGAAAGYFRNLIAKGLLFRIEAIDYEDSLEVTFKEVQP
jgi:hypothetical protein